MLTFMPSVVILVITAYIILAWYLWQRHVFKGPRVDLQIMGQYSLQNASLQNETVAYSLVGRNSNETLDKGMKSD